MAQMINNVDLDKISQTTKMEKMTSPPLENPSSYKVNGISIILVVSSSGLNFLSKKVSKL